MFGAFFDQPMGQHGPMWSQMGPCEPICAQWSPYGIIWADVGSYSLHVGPGGTYAAIWAHMGCQKPCGRTCSKPRLSQVPGPPYPYIYIDKHHTHNKHIFHTAIHKNVSSLGYDPFAGPALDIQRGRIKHPSTPFGSPVVLRRMNICICCMMYKPFIFFLCSHSPIHH